MTTPQLDRTELILLGRMVHHSSQAGPFPRDVAQTFARELGVSWDRAEIVRGIYDRRDAMARSRDAMRGAMLGLLAPKPEAASSAT